MQLNYREQPSTAHVALVAQAKQQGTVTNYLGNHCEGNRGSQREILELVECKIVVVHQLL